MKRNKPATKIDMSALMKDVQSYPDAYLHERAFRFGVSVTGIFLALRRLGIRYKKTLKHPRRSEERRRIFQHQIALYQSNKRPIVYIDESSFAHDMPRTHGYAAKGVRCIGIQDWQAKGRTNAIGALLGKALLTVALFTFNINADVFTAWVEQDLLPKLPPNLSLIHI